MVNNGAYDIVVHYKGRKLKIPNVDPNGYLYINLLYDVAEKALSEMPGNANMMIHMRHEIPGTCEMRDANDDNAVVEMFKMHQSGIVINLHVYDMEIIPSKPDGPLNHNNVQNTQENLGIEQTYERVVVDLGNSDDEFEDSSSEESWKHVLDNDNEGDIDDDRVSVESSDLSDTNFSDFEENEDCEVVPDSESDQELDPMREVMRSKMWVYNPREEIEFEKGQLFTNVDSFRAALKDYVIQKGFPVVRLKNEKTRVTAICGIDGCKWRIHASPVADSITFMIKSYQPEHTCVMDKSNVEATSDWIAKKLVPLMRDHPNISS
mgnify:CR=1 FL=1